MKIGSLIKNNQLHFFMSFKNNYPILFLIPVLFFFSCAQNNTPEVHSFSGITMGTTYSIKIVDPSNKPVIKDIQTKIDSALVDVNKQMSTYIDDSELSVFNKLRDTAWFKVSHDLAVVINDAIIIGEETKNIYDITVGPIVNLWGFGPIATSHLIPDDHEILEAKNRTGIDKIKVNLESSLIKKTIPDLYCDLSSIAKGFGVDKVGLLIEKYGFYNYMVEIGGEVRTKGKNNNLENWRIGISSPLSDGLQKIVSLSDISVATSGDYLNYFEKDGIRYSHLINPLTGRPVTHNLASVTVLFDNCTIADAYATAIDVMGPEVGYKFALDKKLPVFMIVRENNGFIEKMTPQFEGYIVKEK